VLLAGALGLPAVPVHGQPAVDKGEKLRGTDSMQSSDLVIPNDKRERGPQDVFPTFAAVLSAIFVLVVVCMPSRKS
jgi:hypothetical protein